MGFYLVEGSYTSGSAKAMVGAPNDRSSQASSLVASVGGTLHHFFFSLGDSDYIVLCELPDDMSAAAISLALGSTGAFSKTRTTKLLTAQEGQAAMAKAQTVKYSAPTSA